MTPPDLCSHCGKAAATAETDSGEEVCTACGAVLATTRLVAQRPVDETVHLDRHATVIAGQLPVRGRLHRAVPGVTGQRASGGISRSRGHWREQQRRLASSLDMGAGHERAWHLFARCLDGGLAVRPRRLVAAVCILLVLRESGRAMSLAELSEHLGCDTSVLKRVYRQTERFLDAAQCTERAPAATDPTSFLAGKMARLRAVAKQYDLPAVTARVEQNARIMLMYAARAGLVTGRRPDTLAVIALLFALEAELGCDLDSVAKGLEARLSEALGVASTTVGRGRCEQRRVLAAYVRSLPDLAQAERLSEERRGCSPRIRPGINRAFFAASLRTLVARWREIIEDPENAMASSLATATGDEQASTPGPTPTLERSVSTAAKPPAAAALASLVQPHAAGLPAFEREQFALPANEPPALVTLHMADFQAPSFERASASPAATATDDTTSCTLEQPALVHPQRSASALAHPELTEEDLSAAEERAYLRTTDEVHAYLNRIDGCAAEPTPQCANANT
ncbi:hypothetical protein THASP1DRAFT_27133 [Thamnocephalis sphaerospora]|uniref:TFIIB-type domain-containing protein n=1 Tax=Thamnocephalis sphaerospora TaxID=78915 RepID=A0A4V1IXH7_9FUNG|nr:hypothetical protein THASP1DRAFT_27133 [Thamnocephalis sphaerospora]|eukprot:RKP11099.1 hypothetical protein THASP1DRAFT_27133 [Thamnocephalis sphaerospora]